MWRAFTNGKPSKNTRIMQLRMECTRNIKYRVCSPDEEGKSHRGGGRIGTEKNFHWRLLAGLDSLEATTVSLAEEEPSS